MKNVSHKESQKGDSESGTTVLACAQNTLRFHSLGTAIWMTQWQFAGISSD